MEINKIKDNVQVFLTHKLVDMSEIDYLVKMYRAVRLESKGIEKIQKNHELQFARYY